MTKEYNPKYIQGISTGNISNTGAEDAYASTVKLLGKEGYSVDYAMVHGSLKDLAIYQMPGGITATARCKNRLRPTDPNWQEGMSCARVLSVSDITDTKELVEKLIKRNKLFKL